MADPPVDEQSPTDVAAAAPAPARGGGADYRRQRHSLAGAVFCELLQRYSRLRLGASEGVGAEASPPEAAEGALSGAPGTPADDDLMIVSSDDEGAPPARVVELPSTVKKLRPLGVYASTVRAAGWDGARCCTGAW